MLQLELFADPVVDNDLAGHVLRCAATVDRIVAIAMGTKPRRPDGGGAADGVRWWTTPAGIEVTAGDARALYRWRQIDQAIAQAITPGICSALAAWTARWRSMHDARPCIDVINGHRAYSWPTFLYVTSLAAAIEADVRSVAALELEAAA